MKPAEQGRGASRVLAAVLAFPVLGCGSSPRWLDASSPQWPALRRELEAERRAQPRAPWAAQVSAVLRVPGRAVSGRGALAAAPGTAVRMVLVGGPGATLLDVWVTRDRWRLAVPPLGRVLRGARDEPPELPVGFLRWWFCAPYEGALAGAARGQDGASTYLLRSGDATLELRDAPHAVTATRTAGGRTQRVRQTRAGPMPRPGDTVHYEDDAGVTLDLVLESVSDSPPSPEAFVDPDQAQP